MADTDPTQLGPRYDFGTIDRESDSVHADVVRLVGDASRVLELGPATGYMSHAFADRGCKVVGIEIHSEMAKRASQFCERVIVGDLDSLNFEAELGDERFDVIVAADVLEHLKDPLDALNRLRPFLKSDGCFVISVPNVAHGSVRLALLSGHFDYQNTGLLDSTHLRFFTRGTLEQLLDEAELGLAELHRHELNLDASEVPFDPEAVPSQVQEALDNDLDARTYQFVVKAIPMDRDGLRELQRRLREVAELREAASRADELKETLTKIAGREGELRRALIDANDQLLRRDGEIEGLHEALEVCNAEVEAARAAMVPLQVRLDRILASPPLRFYAGIRKLPGLRRIQRRREAGFNAELTKRAKPGQ